MAHWFADLDPALRLILIAHVVGGLIDLSKRVKGGVLWALIPSRFKPVPAAVIGALLTAAGDAATAASTPTVLNLILDAALGVYGGLAAGGGHEVITRLRAKTAPPTSAPPSPNPTTETTTP